MAIDATVFPSTLGSARAVEIFLQALLTRSAEYAASRNAKTMTVLHLKHCIEQEKQWDFLKELTAKVSQVGAEEEGEESSAPKKGRKRRNSQSKAPSGGKKKHVQAEEEGSGSEEAEEETPESSLQLASASGTTQHIHVPVFPPGSTLPTPQPSTAVLSQLQTANISSSSLVTNTSGGGETRGPPLSALAAGLQQTTSNQDDDYDE